MTGLFALSRCVNECCAQRDGEQAQSLGLLEMPATVQQKLQGIDAKGG